MTGVVSADAALREGVVSLGRADRGGRSAWRRGRTAAARHQCSGWSTAAASRWASPGAGGARDGRHRRDPSGARSAASAAGSSRGSTSWSTARWSSSSSTGRSSTPPGTRRCCGTRSGARTGCVGWAIVVVRITWAQLERPGAVAAAVRAALRSCDAGPGRTPSEDPGRSHQDFTFEPEPKWCEGEGSPHRARKLGQAGLVGAFLGGGSPHDDAGSRRRRRSGRPRRAHGAGPAAPGRSAAGPLAGPT